ncbi:MAG: DUF2267 domain-containing protein [Phycisphaerae bacterium]
MKSLEAAKQKADLWLKQMKQIAGTDDDQQVWLMLRASLHAVRDRLPVDEAADLASQLPLVIRGLFYESWKPAETPITWRSAEEFLQAVSRELEQAPDINPRTAVTSTLELLEERITQGEIQNVRQMFPLEMREFWPESARE